MGHYFLDIRCLVLVKSITSKSSLFGKSAKVSQKNAKNRLAVIFLAFFPLRPYRQISIPVATYKA